MKKLGLVLPVLLVASLLGMWQFVKSKRVSPQPNLSESRRSAAQGISQERADTPPPISEDLIDDSPEIRQVRALLLELTELARRIDSKESTLGDLRRRTSQPDATMWRLRVLGHEHPEFLRLIDRYVRSDEPLAARIFALFSFVCPQSSECIEFIASVIRNPPSATVANASCLCFSRSAGNGIGDAWNSLFNLFLGELGLPKGYCAEPGSLVFKPEDAERHPDLVRSIYNHADLTPLTSAIITMLATSEEGVWRNMWIRFAKQGVDHGKVTSPDRERLRELVDHWYLHLDPGSGRDGNTYRWGNGWYGAMEALTSSASARDLNVIGAGLGRLTPDFKAYVLNEISHLAGWQLFEPPFRSHLDEVIAYLSRKPEEGGPGSQWVHYPLCVKLVLESPSEDWIRRILAKNTLIFRNRIAISIASYANADGYPPSTGRRYFSVASDLISDPDFSTRLSAASTIALLSNKKVLGAEDLAQARLTLDQWISKESARPLTSGESERLSELVKSLQR